MAARASYLTFNGQSDALIPLSAPSAQSRDLNAHARANEDSQVRANIAQCIFLMIAGQTVGACEEKTMYSSSFKGSLPLPRTADKHTKTMLPSPTTMSVRTVEIGWCVVRAGRWEQNMYQDPRSLPRTCTQRLSRISRQPRALQGSLLDRVSPIH